MEVFIEMLNAMSPYLLLGFLVAGILYVWVPSQIYSRYLSGTGPRSVLTAAAFGIPLPLCSCGVLPTAVALRRSGASRAATTSFLIATPQTGVDSIAATYSMMGLPFAIVRPVAALFTALAGGLAVGRWEKRQNHNDAPCADNDGDPCECDSCNKPKSHHDSFAARCLETLRYAFFEMIQNIGGWLVVGLVIATLITVLVPDDFFTTYATIPVVNMIVILLVAVPMYICATGSIPIAAALILKGLSPGCALVMLMAGPAVNVASALVVSKEFGKKPMLIYLASIIIGAVTFGLLIDYLPGVRTLFNQAMPTLHTGHDMSADWFSTTCSVVLVAMLIVAFATKYVKSYQLHKNQHSAMKQFKIKGMSCNHCKSSVEKGIASLPGVTSVKVDLAKGIAYVEGDPDNQAVIDKINELGFEFVE
ncbi:MAG: SO_0444 family Cu/Zn efflux transporter [Muribaculaceae bacterium]|nr:SO_0444 family Cu/Zn efflux transporter [Muribaculaceae bacterium]